MGSRRLLNAANCALLTMLATAVPLVSGSPAVAAPSWLRDACSSAAIRAQDAEGVALPVVSDACDLRGKVIAAGDLGVTVPTEDDVSVTAYANYGAAGATDADAHHAVTVNVRGGVVTTEVDVESEVDQRDDVPPDPGPAEGTPVEDKPAGEESGASSLAKPPECSQNSWKWQNKYNGYMPWRIYDRTIPSYLNYNNTIADLRGGAEIIDKGYNDCGFRQSLGTDPVYEGLTSSYPDITSSAKCQGNDGENTVGFGNIRPANILAVTCVWTSWRIGDDAIVQADILFDNSQNVFFYLIPYRCSNRYDLRGVAAHEFGHAFGLGHVSERQYPRLTMSPNATPCSYSDATLGQGDYNGLKRHYGS